MTMISEKNETKTYNIFICNSVLYYTVIMKINIPTIKNAAQAKRWNFWVKEDFYNPRTFPCWVVDLLVKEHLRHFEGYNLFYFMTANGYNKEKMGVLLTNMYTYDKRKVDNLIKSSKKEKFYNKKYFDLLERDIVYPDLSINIEEYKEY